MTGANASEVIRHIVSAILPPSAVMAEAARLRAGDLAGWLAGARHDPRPTLASRLVLVVAADHGVLDPGISLGRAHPTIAALTAIVDGDAALVRVARGAAARLLVVDAGIAEFAHVPPATLRLSVGQSLGDLATGAALTRIDVLGALEVGIAAATALVEEGLDVLAVGALGLGGDLAAAAVIAALLGAGAELAPQDGRALVAAGLAHVPPGASTFDIVAAVGGRDLAVMAGVLLTAAALHIPVVLDGVVTLAAALIAVRIAPEAAGYLLAAHAGGGPAATAARQAVGLIPLLSAGLGHGEGTGAAMALPLLAAAATALA
jgi:nicotinate-nucleotide--dimethylbenzimidazole phosphoribosyltransferase